MRIVVQCTRALVWGFAITATDCSRCFPRRNIPLRALGWVVCGERWARSEHSYRTIDESIKLEGLITHRLDGSLMIGCCGVRVSLLDGTVRAPVERRKLGCITMGIHNCSGMAANYFREQVTVGAAVLYEVRGGNRGCLPRPQTKPSTYLSPHRFTTVLQVSRPNQDAQYRRPHHWIGVRVAVHAS